MTTKTSKFSRSTAVAAMAAILTFGVASVHEAAAAPVQRVQHRQPHTAQAPAVRPNGNGAYASSRSVWPCVGTDTAGEFWSAYPAWEIGCK